MPKNQNKKEIRITTEDIETIFGYEYKEFLAKIVPNCFCSNCTPPQKECVTIVNYEAFLNDHNDVVLRGSCAKCGRNVGRYVETGEVAEFEKRIDDIKKKYAK